MLTGDRDQDGGHDDLWRAPSFPDVPKLELDELLHQLIARAQDVASAQGRLRALLRANQSIVGNLTLPALLLRTVQAARELTHARYGALGVIDPSGDGLDQFVHVGMDEATVARIGHLPEGKGLLGALIDDPRSIRLQPMTSDPRSVGFPDGHPPMTSFLGVPIRVRSEVYGNLYLAQSERGEFSIEDEELVAALAATAGVAIANARLYEQAQLRQSWLQASTEVTQQLLSAEGGDPLTLIARRAREIATADVVSVALPTADGSRLVVAVAAGDGAEALVDCGMPVASSLMGLAFTSGQPVLTDDVHGEDPHGSQAVGAVPLGPVMVLPLGGAQHARGALVIGRRHGRRRFDDADLEMATTFANHAALALELGDARTDQQRVVLLHDRDRIARDLHDHVIQRLFAVGLTVQSVASSLRADEVRAAQLDRAVANIDETIRQTRTTIFQLHGVLGPETGTVRARLLAIVAEVSALLGFEPHVRFSGPIDAILPEPIVADLVAVLREALTNTARHASASAVDIDVDVDVTSLAVLIADDGVGIGDSERRSGLANLRVRAERYGGVLELATGTSTDPQPNHEGTRLRWTIPLR
jgi:signal transduction histidine kinase